MSLALGSFSSRAFSGPDRPGPFRPGAVTRLIRLQRFHRHDRRQQGESFRRG